MFINNAQDLDSWDGKVYVVDQIDPKTGEFDEHKIMYGFGSEAEARDAYLSNYEEGWQGLGRITGVDKDTFDKWLDSSDRKIKEFAEHSITRDALARQELGEKKPVADAEIDKALMNEVMKEPASKGVEFITDTDEGQRVLDEANGSGQVKKMGQKTNKKKAQIAADLEGNELTPEQQAVVYVFTGNSNNSTLSFTRDGKQRRVIMRKGNEVRAGAEHSLFRHYGTTEGVISSEDVLRIPGVLATGERTPVKRGKTQLYEYTLTDANGVKYTVVTENKHGREEFADFYTNKKATSAARQHRPKRHVQLTLITLFRVQRYNKILKPPRILRENSSRPPTGTHTALHTKVRSTSTRGLPLLRHRYTSTATCGPR